MLCCAAFSLTTVTAAWAADFGDAPEGSLAYPDTCVVGSFPTCMSVGPAGWIEHDQPTAWFGPSVDGEADGNGGHCPLFDPNMYDRDECFGDGDAGLLIQPSHTIKGAVGDEFYFTCAGDIFGMLGKTCDSIFWGSTIDLEVHNHIPDSKIAYVNVLVDWNRDGRWSGLVYCAAGAISERVLVNFPIPNPYDGKLSSLIPPPITIGPTPGYLWARFSITDEPLPTDAWDGSGLFAVGETEDHLLYVRRAESPGQNCGWLEGSSYKIHWPQLPDLSSAGMDVVMYPEGVADDFLCTESGPIQGIHFWASFAGDCLPAGGAESASFSIKIYDDVPATASESFSHPGKLLWSHVFNTGEYSVRIYGQAPQGWYDPNTEIYQSNDNTTVYQYDFCLDGSFEQQEGTVYWLEIESLHWFLEPAPPIPDYFMGWKTTDPQHHWNDDAVWRDPQAGWRPLEYPSGHTLAGKTVDLAFVITGGDSAATVPAQHLKWSQPPLESDPVSKTPIFCGWDEPAHAYHPARADTTVWQLVADDFRCFGGMPVTSIHWWGSYLNWEKTAPPQSRPSSWHIAFWSNVPSDSYYNYSRPSAPLWQLDVPADAVSESYVGLDRFPDKPTDACFHYSLKLQPHQYFRQQEYLNRTQDNVFWISITAMYADGALPESPWGWKTRPQPWMDNAIRTTMHRDTITDNVLLVPGAMTPITDSAICDIDEKYDMAFQLDTDPGFIKWEQSFTGMRRWPHYEDQKSIANEAAASNVRVLKETVIRQVADDFQCTNPLPITAAVWWGSYIGYDYTACACPDPTRRPRRPSYFLLSLWKDSPTATPTLGNADALGSKVWEYRAYEFDEVMVGYDKHPEGSSALQDREPVFRYSVRFPEDEWFYQKEDNSVYWFSVVAVYPAGMTDPAYPWGWTNHAHHFGADAGAWAGGNLTPAQADSLTDENGVGIDMSFVLFTDPNEISKPPYQPTSRPATPTQCPPVDTQCPEEETRCPPVESYCPPRTPTNCPSTYTQCPQETVCPQDPTRCYEALTLCPSITTTCPVEATFCPPDETRCPRQPSRCIVCPLHTGQEPTSQVSMGLYLEERCDRALSTSERQSQALYERPCPIVETQCLTLP
jgi:hypothetical protein